MGGRGAIIGFQNNSGNFKIKVTDTFDQDSETTKQTHIVKKLKNRNVIVMQSTDNIQYDILTPNLKQLDKILSTTKPYYKFLEKEKLYIRTEEFADPRINAGFRCNEDEFHKPQIIFNKNLENKTRKKVEQTVRQQILVGHWTKSDNDQLVNRTMTHELGHYVQRMLTHKYVDQNDENKIRSKDPKNYDREHAKEMRAEIEKICYNKFGVKPKSSRYGETSPFEWFAETFAELHTRQKPSYMAQAMDIYLKEKV